MDYRDIDRSELETRVYDRTEYFPMPDDWISIVRLVLYGLDMVMSEEEL